MIFLICFWLSQTIYVFAAHSDLTPELMGKIYEEVEIIKEWAREPLIVNAVKTQNAEGLSSDQIRQRDAKWVEIKRSNKQIDAFMERKLSHPAGKWLRYKNEESKGRYPEMFLCDNKGANVAVSKITSDFWQGDEGKWIRAFNNGKGNVVFGEAEFDSSAGVMQVQISVPVMEQGKAIGVLIVGVKFSALKE